MATPKKIRGYEKAAIFIMAIGEDAASEVMKNLEDREINKIISTMSKLGDIGSQDIDAIIKEFHENLEKGGGALSGEDYIRQILIKALGTEKARSVLGGLTKPDESGLETLRWLDAKSIATLIKGEHPQTIAIILAHLEPDHSADVISYLPESLRTDVLFRIATMEGIQPEVIEELEAALHGAIAARAAHSSVSGGVQTVAEILNNLDSATEGAVMGELEGINPDLAAQIQKLMFVFNDLIKLDDKAVQMMLKEIENNDLVLALKTADEELKSKILKNMSERAAQMLKEDMEIMGPAKLSDVEKAQQSILKVVKRLDQEGKIVIGRGSDLVF